MTEAQRRKLIGFIVATWVAGAFLLVAVWWTGYQGRVADVAGSRKVCMETTETRVVAARKAAADAVRDFVLSDAAQERTEAEVRRLAAVQGEQAARRLLEQAGIETSVGLRAILLFDPETEGFRAQRQAYCEAVWPDAPVLPS